MDGQIILKNALILLQIAGIIIPLIGIVVLLGKEQSKASAYLMLANVSCLIVNVCYYMMLKSTIDTEAMLALKIQYFGNALFYFFFILFILSYLRLYCPRIIYICWIVFEIVEIAILWQDNYRSMVFNDMNIEIDDMMGIHFIKLDGGYLYHIKYGIIGGILSILLLYTLFKVLRTQAKAERHSLIDLAMVQGVVLIALIFSIGVKLDYDIIPICTSLVIFNLIISMLKGELFNVADQGRTWAFEHVDDAFVIVDSAYGYLDSNKCARKLFPELRGKEKNGRVPEELYKIFVSEEKSIIYDEHYYIKVVKALKQDIKKRGIMLNKRTETEERLVGYCLVLADVTEQHNMMEELSDAKDRAEDANRAKSTFISNMSHEIRTPMNAIVGMTEILLRSDFPVQERGYLMNIKNSGNALLNIINDILDFSKIESGKMTIVEEEYEPMSMLSDLSMIFLTRIGEKKVELLYDIDKELPVKLYGDSLRLRQVIINIVNNAIKFTDEGYVKLTVKVNRLEEENIELYISVKDTGQGIKEEDLQSLFGAFRQVDLKKNHNKEGTGLGLSISKQLVELMGGTIDVRSRYGEGSEFFFTVKQGVTDAKKAAQIKAEEAIGKNITISGCSKERYLPDNLRAMAESYGLSYIEADTVFEQGIQVDYFFTDTDTANDEFKSYTGKRLGAANLVILQNPMKENYTDGNATVVNKPLYSLNFCQVINHEKQLGFSEAEDYINFTAPDARILIVDDNEMNLKVATGLLQPIGMKMDTAENGKEALKMIDENRYDLIFMDHMMPVMDGVETTMLLRKMEGDYFKKVPVIALTANAVVGAKEIFLKAGMNDFVAKPIEMKKMCSKLKTWLPKGYIRKQTERIVAAEKTEDISDIKPMEGIDIAAGIKYSGTKELFINLLGDFYKLIDMKANKIEKCLADRMIRDYTIEVHALKNTARMIGATELSEMFLELERFGNEENIEELESRTPGVLSLYRSYKETLKPYGMQDDNKEETDTSTLVGLLRSLNEAIDSFDLDSADAAIKELDGYRMPEECKPMMDELRAYVADVAMEEVLEITEKMIAVLENA